MTSVAKTLGAPRVASKVLENLPNFNVISDVQPDSAAIEACLKFAGIITIMFDIVYVTKEYVLFHQMTMHSAWSPHVE